MSTTHTQFSNRRWSLVLFLAVLVGIAQFGLGQFSPWVIAAPFVALLVMDVEGRSRGDGVMGRRGEGVLVQVAMAFVFHGIMIGAVMTAAGGAGLGTSGRFVMAKSPSAGGCGSGGMCGGGQGAVAKASSAGGCGSGGCGSAAGGCGSGGCGASGSVAAGGKSACGCGSGAKVGDSKAMMVQIPSDGAKKASPNQMRPGLPPIMARPSGTVPGVMNQPIPISPQAMAVISAQPKTTVPRPAQGPAMKLPVPMNAGTEANRSLTGSTVGATEGNRSLPGSTIAPSTNASSTTPPSTAKNEADLPKGTKEINNEPKPADP